MTVDESLNQQSGFTLRARPGVISARAHPEMGSVAVLICVPSLDGDEMDAEEIDLLNVGLLAWGFGSLPAVDVGHLVELPVLASATADVAPSLTSLRIVDHGTAFYHGDIDLRQPQWLSSTRQRGLLAVLVSGALDAESDQLAHQLAAACESGAVVGAQVPVADYER